jgi:hypothetical protein
MVHLTVQGSLGLFAWKKAGYINRFVKEFNGWNTTAPYMESDYLLGKLGNTDSTDSSTDRLSSTAVEHDGTTAGTGADHKTYDGPAEAAESSARSERDHADLSIRSVIDFGVGDFRVGERLRLRQAGPRGERPEYPWGLEKFAGVELSSVIIEKLRETPR